MKSTGKVPTFTITDTKGVKILAIANFYLNAFTQENQVDWSILYISEQSFGTVSATDSFDIDTDSIYKISDRPDDKVRINHTDGIGFTDYDIVSHDALKKYYGQDKTRGSLAVCAQVGSSLVFAHEFISTDPQFGGELLVPCYLKPDPLVDSSDDVLPGIENWLTLISAAEYVRTDITLQGQYPNLIAEANQAMLRLKDDNEAQVEEVDRPWNPGGSTW